MAPADVCDWTRREKHEFQTLRKDLTTASVKLRRVRSRHACWVRRYRAIAAAVPVLLDRYHILLVGLEFDRGW